MRVRHVLYAYPVHHLVSFTLVARKHVEYMRSVIGINVYEVNELAFPLFTPIFKYTAIAQPGFFIMHRVLKTRVDVSGRLRGDYYDWWRSKYEQLIGVDVCDSDSYSQIAVDLANRYDKFIVPSSFCLEVAGRAGIKAKLYRIPHGVDPDWYTAPSIWEASPVKSINPALLQLYLYKVKKNKKLVLFWLWHSSNRKGWLEVKRVYERLVKERGDIVLVLKTHIPNTPEYQEVMHLGVVNIYGWLTEYEKMALYDLVDATINFSRGGGFELNCLESLTRGTPCVASNWGSWIDYVPEFLRVKPGMRVQPLPGNTIHTGYGYAVDVESAVDKLHDILDNIDDYKQRVLDYRDKYLSSEYRWDLVAKKLVEVVEN